MKLICIHCGKSFEGNNTKFCSPSCRDSHITTIEKRVREAVNDDHGHTEKFSRD